MDEDNTTFRQPLFVDTFGLYITSNQMEHYLMRPEGESNFHAGSIDFFRYLNYCRIYNFLYDASEKDPKQAQMYWDSELNTVAFMYKKKGKVDNYLRKLKERNAFFGADSVDEDDSSYFGRGLDEDLS